LLVLVRSDSTLADEKLWFGLWLADAHPHELPGQKPAVGIVEYRPELNGAARHVDPVVDELQVTTDRLAIFTRLHLDGNAFNCALPRGIGWQFREDQADDLLADVESHIDRIHRNQRGEQGR